jgi:hypothetical protein
MAKERPKLLVADKKGRIYDVPHLEATGMKGGEYFRLDPGKLVKLHPDSELFVLPDRKPVGTIRGEANLFKWGAILSPGGMSLVTR